ncbi:DUF4221 domain-containing protein [Belliella sp. DSM 111904]|uniref:DUF4221 domain-containing protein n=1 Tax=Belliella filtrata TaxID=2923435 RepID=A0ABS9V2Z5_9BACT|nr:DUF4221 family protein [Belliella filtrata]MCH7410786.1 DUF4221 domain-containing protein [Belliella filtrata]
MQNLILLFAFILLISCGGNRDSNREITILTELTYSFDTVMVDTGDEFLNLNDRLLFSDLSNDRKYFFNWNRSAFTIEKINLDELKLVDNIKYEKEGPDGVGLYVRYIASSPDGNIIFWSYEKKGIWDHQGKLIRDLSIESILKDSDFPEDFELFQITQFPNEQDKFLTLYDEWDTNTISLLIFDFSDASFKKIDLPEINKSTEFYSEILFNGSKVGRLNKDVEYTVDQNKTIIISNAYNYAYIYDIVTDSLSFKAWDGPLVGDKKRFQYPKEVEYEKLWESVRLSEEDINFGGFNWDEKNRLYYRFAVKTIFGEEKYDYGAFKPIGAEVYLSIFDEDFNLIAESKIPEFQNKPTKHFVKDGQIWLFENIDDEMGFVRMTIN